MKKLLVLIFTLAVLSVTVFESPISYAETTQKVETEDASDLGSTDYKVYKSDDDIPAPEATSASFLGGILDNFVSTTPDPDDDRSVGEVVKDNATTIFWGCLPFICVILVLLLIWVIAARKKKNMGGNFNLKK